MYDNKNNNEEQNFWVSYADLMAGLLFVFILLVGVIVIKYVYVQNDLQNKDNTLKIQDQKIQDQIAKIKIITSKLQSKQEESLHLSFELAKLNNTYNKTIKDLNASKELTKKLNIDLNNTNNKLLLSTEQISKITKILEDKNNNIELLDKTIQEQAIQISKTHQKLNYTQDEIEKLKELLIGYELKQKEYENTNKKLKDKIEQSSHIITLKDDELELLTNKILTITKEHQKLVEEFDIAKVKIKTLTGIRLKVIQELKKSLGNSINIDPKSGAIKFSSNILFDQGSYILKDSAKKELSKILKKYINALLLNKNIRQYIENITIQGHTNSDGSYLYNLELSQKRALEVMKFLYSLDIKNKYLLEKYISASGRSYSDRIKDKNGFEQKDESRRIEIKFRIKNEEAIKELSNYLTKEK